MILKSIQIIHEILRNNVVDVFIISSPNFTHHDIIKEALKTKSIY